MVNESDSLTPASGSASGNSAQMPQLPDINAETYPFDVVLHFLDQAAILNTISVPSRSGGGGIRSGGGITGIDVQESLHGLRVAVDQPSREKGLSARRQVGQKVASSHHRWLMIPDSFQASPDRLPPETVFDSSRSQRFAMYGGVIRFGEGKDGFHGFGSGKTFPISTGGQTRLLAGAVGTITEGFGGFSGKQGTYTYFGFLDPEKGFSGNLVIRVVDPKGDLLADSVPAMTNIQDPQPGMTYINFRGQKKSRNSKTRYVFKPDGVMEGFSLEQELRAVDVRFTTHGRDGGLLSSTKIGQVIGHMNSLVFLNLLDPTAPPGTPLAPIPFGSRNEFTFTDGSGSPVGGFTAEGGEGRTFHVQFPGAPGQQALRFGAFQAVTKGTGVLAGAQGYMTDNSIVGVAPHATSTYYTLCLVDPDGRYQAALGGG
ncbi:MAG: hypothetical protein K0U98_25445 [Deltaproteobacteria bacterium]|nr:hypothetical protein [Deltaproteobacteria bacterium]